MVVSVLPLIHVTVSNNYLCIKCTIQWLDASYESMAITYTINQYSFVYENIHSMVALSFHKKIQSTRNYKIFLER